MKRDSESKSSKEKFCLNGQNGSSKDNSKSMKVHAVKSVSATNGKIRNNLKQNGKSTLTSQLSTPTKTVRVCTLSASLADNKTGQKIIGNSVPPSPRRKLLRQSALENSKESLTGDEKSATTIINTTAKSHKLVKHLNKIVMTTRDVPFSNHAILESSIISQNNDEKKWTRNNNNNNDNGFKSTSSTFTGTKSIKECCGMKMKDKFQDNLQDKTKRVTLLKKIKEVGHSLHKIDSVTCMKKLTANSNNVDDKSILRMIQNRREQGVSKANTSCELPSPPPSPKSCQGSIAPPSSSPQDKLKLKQIQPPIVHQFVGSGTASNRPTTSKRELPHENGLNGSKNSCKLIETHLQFQPDSVEQQSNKSISRETTFIGIRSGHSQTHDKTQLEKISIQQKRNKILLLKDSDTDIVGGRGSKNKSKMNNSSSLLLSSEKPNFSSFGKSPSDPTSSSNLQQKAPIVRNGIVNKILNKFENGLGEKVNGRRNESTSKDKSRHDSMVQFIQPLPSNLEVFEGSEVELTVKIKGANKVVWVKDDKIIPNIPPDFEYKLNLVDGIYSLKIKDSFIEDSGFYICEAYGKDNESNEICWCHLNVLEEIEDDTSIELEEIPEEQEQPIKRHNFIVPVIITSQASPEPFVMEDLDVESTSLAPNASEKRLNFKDLRDVSCTSSRDIFEDALEDTVEDNCEVDLKNIMKIDQNQSLNNESLYNEIGVIRESEFKPDYSLISEGEVPDLTPYEIESPTEASKLNVSFGGSLEKVPIDNLTEEMSLGVDSLIISEASSSKTLAQKESFVSTDINKKEESPSQNDPKNEENHTTPIISKSQNTIKEEGLPISISQASNEGVLKAVSPQNEVKLYSEDLSPTSPTDVIIPEEKDEFQENTPDNHSIGRSYSSQSSRESYSGCGGSDTFRSSSFEEATPSPIDDNKSNASISGSSVRDSFSIADPRILMGPGNLIVMLGETVNLRVKIQTSDISDTTVSWCQLVGGKYRLLGTNKSDSIGENSHVYICKAKNETSDLITLRINDANYEDSGKYRVKAYNRFGTDSHQCILSVEGPPEPPASPPNVIFDDKSHSVLISWSCCPYDGGSAVTGYCLDASICPIAGNLEESWVTLTPQKFQRLCYTLKNPRSGFSYNFRVNVENAYGKGKPSVTSENLIVPEFSESLISNDKSSLENLIERKISLSNDSEEIAYEYKDVRLKQESILEYYEKFEQLGKGRFGVVFKVTNKTSKKSYAGKFVKCIKGKDKERSQLECQIMNELKYHPKLICLVDAFEMTREIVIVTELISGGELFERVVADDFTLTEHDCIVFLRQICDGVKYIHEKKIMHLDLKPENILCTTKTSNQIKIIDFGLAQHYNPNEPISVLFGTAEFVSPEIINYDTICPATDMWSVGIITYILLSGLSPFLGDNDNETFSNITRGEFDFEDEAFDNISEDSKDFISSLILKRKEKRLTATECLGHKWLALSDAEKKDIVLSTDKLKRFLLRRKWQKTGHAIRAIGRITTLYSSRRSSSGSSTSSSPLFSSLNQTLSIQESVDDNVFGSVDLPDVSKLNLNDNNRASDVNDTSNSNYRAKYNDGSRSDSGICDIASTSNNVNIK